MIKDKNLTETIRSSLVKATFYQPPTLLFSTASIPELNDFYHAPDCGVLGLMDAFVTWGCSFLLLMASELFIDRGFCS